MSATEPWPARGNKGTNPTPGARPVKDSGCGSEITRTALHARMPGSRLPVAAPGVVSIAQIAPRSSPAATGRLAWPRRRRMQEARHVLEFRPFAQQDIALLGSWLPKAVRGGPALSPASKQAEDE